ncbi:DUF948 domain-containing protein [candidate division KSB1 bacterium]|nr:DUF948 domain-containing protein [candidate division KSB1 bacterium]
MIIEISLLVISVFIVIFVIGLLIVLLQFKRTAHEAEKFLDTARQHIAPMAHDATIILNETKRIVESVERQVGSLETGVDALKHTALNIKHFEEDVEKRIEQPLLEITMFISALTKVLRGFVSLFGSKEKA